MGKLNSYNGSDQIYSLENAVLFFQSLQLKNCTHNLKDQFGDNCPKNDIQVL